MLDKGIYLEGAFCSVRVEDDDSELVKQLENKSNIESFTKNGYLFFRKKSVLYLRCLCMYGLHNDAFQKEILEDGRANYTAMIPKEFFSDFCTINDRAVDIPLRRSRQSVQKKTVCPTPENRNLISICGGAACPVWREPCVRTRRATAIDIVPLQLDTVSF